MDRAKAVVIILVCFGLLISFILLVTSVATADLLEKHADEDCLPDRKKKGIYRVQQTQPRFRVS